MTEVVSGLKSGRGDGPRSAEPVSGGGWDRVSGSRLVKRLVVTVLLALLIAFPLMFSNPTVTAIGVWAVIYMTAATCWNGFTGNSGYVSLGTGAFYGTGAYTFGVVAEHLGWPGGYSLFVLVPMGGIVAGIIAIPYGLVAFRTRRHQFVIVTIALFFVFQLIAYNVGWLGGTYGIFVPNAPWRGATFNDRFYYAGLILLVAVVAFYSAMRRTRFGLHLLTVRDDEDRALSLGVKTGRVKMIAFVISAVPIGMAGAIYAYYIGQVLPEFAFDPTFDAAVAVMCIAGGLGTLAGPLIGAAVLESLQQYITLQFSSSDLYLIIYGVLFVAVVLFLPQGIVPTLARRRRGMPPVVRPTARIGDLVARVRALS